MMSEVSLSPACMSLLGRFGGGASGKVAVGQAEDIDNIVARRGQLRLSRRAADRLSLPPWPLTMRTFLQPLRAISLTVSCSRLSWSARL